MQTLRIRKVSALAAVALALSACSGPQESAGLISDPPIEAEVEVEETPNPEPTPESSGPEGVAAESGLILEGDEIPESLATTDHVRPGNLGLVRTPAGDLTVESLASVPAIETVNDEWEEEVLVPAEGETFRLLTLSFERLDNEHRADVVIDTGGLRRQLVDLTGGSDGWGWSGDDLQFLVAASDGARLVISSTGAEQLIDLSTGQRVPDAQFDGYYAALPQATPHMFDFPAQTVKMGSREFDIKAVIHLRSVEMTAYAENWTGGDGWAPEGKAWLLINFDTEILNDGHIFSQLDRPTFSWEAVAENGETAEVSLDLDTRIYSEFAKSVTVAIPVSASTGTFTLSPSISAEPSGDVRPKKINFEMKKPIVVELQPAT